MDVLRERDDESVFSYTTIGAVNVFEGGSKLLKKKTTTIHKRFHQRHKQLGRETKNITFGSCNKDLHRLLKSAG
jgi:hypothetical protein